MQVKDNTFGEQAVLDVDSDNVGVSIVDRFWDGDLRSGKAFPGSWRPNAYPVAPGRASADASGHRGGGARQVPNLPNATPYVKKGGTPNG